MPATSMIVVTTLAAHVVSTCLCPPMSGVYIYTHILTCLAMQLDASGAGPVSYTHLTLPTNREV